MTAPTLSTPEARFCTALVLTAAIALISCGENASKTAPDDAQDAEIASDSNVSETGEEDATGPSTLRLLSGKATAPGQITLRFSGPLAAEQPGFDPAQVVSGLTVYDAWVGQDPKTLVLDTAHHIARGYPIHVRDLRAKDGRKIDPLFAVALVDGLAPDALLRWDSKPPVKSKELAAAGWNAQDHPKATANKPGKWSLVGGAIVQRSNIHGGNTTVFGDANRPGTYFILHKKTPPNVFIQGRLKSNDDDAIGLVARFTDGDNHYRFEWDRQRWRRRLVKVSNGVSTELAFDTERFEEGRYYTVRLLVVGGRVAAIVNGKTVLTAVDATPLLGGKTGLFSWGNDDTFFRNIVVQPVQGPKVERDGPSPIPRPDAPLASHGVLAAEVTHNKAMLWTRASWDATLRFSVAPIVENSVAWDKGTTTKPVAAAAASDRTAMADIKDLKPDTVYAFRAALSSAADAKRTNLSPIGRFRTAPLPTAATSVVFTVASDFHVSAPQHFAMLDDMRKHKPSFVLTLGDFPYSDAQPAAKTQPAYFAKFREIRAFSAIRRLGLQVPWFSTWDDHEIANNWDGATPKSLVQAGKTAFRTYFPTQPANPGSGIYRTFSWGNQLQVFMLDTRSFRSANKAKDGPTKTMLGTTQRDWLKGALKASKARWKVIVTTVALRYGTTGSDHWAGFANERTWLFDTLKTNKISGVFFLAGDQHWSAIHKHPEGYIEVQACPISAPLRDPPKKLHKAVTWLAKKHSWGLVRVDAKTGKATVEIRGAGNKLLHTEPIPHKS